VLLTLKNILVKVTSRLKKLTPFYANHVFLLLNGYYNPFIYRIVAWYDISFQLINSSEIQTAE